ncbi:MAG: hypothetical protein M3R16_10300, partial [Pseudomonadota bacterium]|nr:hypothetical protein [Pseudomonadota bacterium]
MALAASVAATLLVPSATARQGQDDVVRHVDKPNVKFFDASKGGHVHGLRCAVKDPGDARMDAINAVLRSRANARSGDTSRGKPGSGGGGGTWTPISIPVQVHVITSGGQGGVTSGMISNQINELNSAYAGRGFSFILAATRVVENPAWYDTCETSATESQMKNALA